ncbi:MAG: hypothetical protein WA071_00135 [Undibacterium umbellatum]|uniref:hypothetical protein n=1 Tax=Undibacterium umbellatum TaxID=2762300 RepID=UPI003BB5C9E9
MKRKIALTGAFLVGLAVSLSATAQRLPGDAEKLLPSLKAEIDQYWPGLAPRSFLPALIEQESLWKIGATLKTSRELGCGLGQFTRATNADGTTRFDALAETRLLHPSLAGWSWKDCYAVQYQLRAVVIKTHLSDERCSLLLDSPYDIKACAAAIHNGGAGSMSKRIKLCSLAQGCNPRRWFSNLERQCPQSRVKVQGYGEDFCTINSKYPGRVFARMPKYEGRL